VITDPTLTTPIARILALTEETELYNCPLGGGGTNVRVSGKPESRAPGHQNAPWLVRDVAAVLERTVRDIKALNDDAKLRDRTDAPHESIGGVSVEAPEVEGTAYRRHKRRVSITVVETHLVAKADMNQR
jgi:hypothetical protein